MSDTEHDWAGPDPWALAGKSRLNASNSHREKSGRKISLALEKKGHSIPDSTSRGPGADTGLKGDCGTTGVLWLNHISPECIRLRSYAWGLQGSGCSHSAASRWDTKGKTVKLQQHLFCLELLPWCGFKIGVSGWGYNSMVAFLMVNDLKEEKFILAPSFWGHSLSRWGKYGDSSVSILRSASFATVTYSCQLSRNVSVTGRRQEYDVL